MAPALRPDLTHVQYRILRLLGDGMDHTINELHECLDDDLGPLRNVYAHVSTLRRIIRPRGLDIISGRKRRGAIYRMVRLVGGGNPRAE